MPFLTVSHKVFPKFKF